jgi:hypothetical protein
VEGDPFFQGFSLKDVIGHKYGPGICAGSLSFNDFVQLCKTAPSKNDIGD